MNKLTADLIAYKYAISVTCDKYSFPENALYLLIVFNDTAKPLNLLLAAQILDLDIKRLTKPFNLLKDYIYIKSSFLSITLIEDSAQLYYITSNGVNVLNDFYMTFDKKRKDLLKI